MFTISTIGSCRIATPVRLCRERFGLTLNRAKNYGFVHSSAEAVQQAKFQTGEFTPDPELWNLIARGPVLNDLLKQPHELSDIYIVELSSAKTLKVDGQSVQLNYLSNEYPGIFQDKKIAKAFWNVVRNNDERETARFVTELPNSHLLSEKEHSILSKISFNLTSEEELRDDIRCLKNILPNVLFVTHVNALKADGSKIRTRSEYIELVKKVASEENCEVYDPTPRMIEFGQEFAIEDHSESLAHYTDDFAHILYKDWHDSFIVPTLARQLEADESSNDIAAFQSFARAQTIDARGDDLSAQLISASTGAGKVLWGAIDPSLAELIEYRNFSAAEKLIDFVDSQPTGLNLAEGRKFALAVTKRDFDALDQMLEDDSTTTRHVSPENLVEAASYAKEAGRLTTALNCYKRALSSSEGLELAAGDFIQLILDLWESDGSQTVDLPTDIINYADPRNLIRVKMASEVDAGLSAIPDGFEVLRWNEQLGIASDAVRWRRFQIGSAMINEMRNANLGDPRRLRELNGLADEIFRSFERADTDIEAEHILTVLAAHPLHTEARIAFRSLRNKLLAQARNHYQDGNLEQLLTLRSKSPELSESVPIVALFVARLAAKRGLHDLALKSAVGVRSELHENLTVHAIIMRSALELGHLTLVDEAAQQILELADGESERIRNEAELRLERLPVLAKKQLVLADDDVEGWRIADIAARDERYQDTARRRQKVIEAKLINEIRQMEADKLDELPVKAFEILDIMPENQKVLLSIGRYHVKKKDFDASLPHWDRLVEIAPDNQEFRFQRDRANERALKTA